MVPPGRRPSRVAAAALVAALVAGGCATLPGSGPAGEGGTAGTDGATGTEGDSARADLAGDSVVRAATDSAYLALLDSARALARGGGEPAATPEADTTGADGEASEEADGDGDGDDGYPAGPVTVTDVDSLRALGPVYTPYDRGPVVTTRAARLDGLLKATLVPVIRRYELPPDEWARYWVLVDRRGEVRTTVLQLPSGHGAFDEAARAVAESLRFRPATRDGEAVPVWILTRISLLMR